ncbi:hypothetical protein FB567DRAFT_51755 [Paraphoma chrysanthemicola]|uniref:Uncharacterized protein n=1 Tax=Paraphoma chrysanthemicola TaxID=798071 RepID=A0A8K0R7G0_9PLEO|nr:hypothetical protein FB567DRAFT_51755 [Paraphoma chrysanthemicola]
MAANSPTRAATQLSHSEAKTLTTRNALHSPLLRLPRELRDLVFDFVFSDLLIDTLPEQAGIHVYNHRAWAKQPFTASLLIAITSTSCQIHVETFLLPFQLCEFYFASMEALVNMVDQLTSQQQHAIKRVRVPVQGPFDGHSEDQITYVLHCLTGLEGVMLWMLPNAWGKTKFSDKEVKEGYVEGICRILGRTIEVQID